MNINVSDEQRRAIGIAEHLVSAGRAGEAAGICEKLLEQTPEWLPAHIGRISALAVMEDFAAAERALSDAESRFASSPDLQCLRAQLCELRDDYQAAIHAWKLAAEAEPRAKAEFLRASAFQAAVSGDADSALAFLDDYLKHRSMPVKLLLKLSVLLEHALGESCAMSVLNVAVNRHPTPELFISQASIGARDGQPATIRKSFEGLQRHPGKRPGHYATIARHFLNCGAFEDCAQAIAAGAAAGMPATKFEEVQGLLEMLVRDPPPDNSALAEKGYWARPHADAETTLVVFCGLAQQAGMPLAALHMHLSGFNANLIYVRDPQRLLFVRGVPGFGDDMQATVRGLRNIIDGFGAKRLQTFGGSAGGFAAIRYGIELGASASLVAAPVTAIDAKSREFDQRARAVVSRARAAAPERMENLRAALQNHSPALRLTCYYGTENREDTFHAENIKDVEGVTVIPIKGYPGHDALAHLASTGKLPGILNAFMHAPGRETRQ